MQQRVDRLKLQVPRWRNGARAVWLERGMFDAHRLGLRPSVEQKIAKLLADAIVFRRAGTKARAAEYNTSRSDNSWREQ
jgi:hypothetical protein